MLEKKDESKSQSSAPAEVGAGTSPPPVAPPIIPSTEPVEKWDQDVSEHAQTDVVVKTEEVTERDKFKLAKNVLLASAVIYTIIAVATICILPAKTEDVWNFSKVALNSLVAVVVGYYFGKK